MRGGLRGFRVAWDWGVEILEFGLRNAESQEFGIWISDFGSRKDSVNVKWYGIFFG